MVERASHFRGNSVCLALFAGSGAIRTDLTVFDIISVVVFLIKFVREEDAVAGVGCLGLLIGIAQISF